MAGLLQRAVGGAMAGAGQGLVANARMLREETLLRIRETNADRRNQRAINARAEEGRLTREAGAEQGRLNREAAADARGEALVTVLDEAGNQILVPTSEASGRRVPGKTPKNPPRLYVLSEDPVTGEKTYGTREQALGEAGAADAQTRSAEVDAAAEDMSSWWPEWMGGSRNPTDDERTRAYEIARKNPQMTGKEAMMRAMGMGGRGEEPGPGGAAKPTGEAPPKTSASCRARARWMPPTGPPPRPTSISSSAPPRRVPISACPTGRSPGSRRWRNSTTPGSTS